MANELDELLALVSTPEDKAAMQAIIDRNAAAKTRLEVSQSVYGAFIAGDDAAITQASKDAAARAAAAATSTATTGNKGLDLDLDQLGQIVDQRAATRFKALTESPDYIAAEEARIEKVATAVAKKLAPEILTTAARTSDEIYQVRASHSREFSEELDTTKFTEFLNANPGKFADLSKAHDAFVGEQRIQAQITKGVETELAKRTADAPPIEVPGTSLPSAESPLGSMIRANKLTTGETARGPAIDAATKAFRTLQQSHATH